MQVHLGLSVAVAPPECRTSRVDVLPSACTLSSVLGRRQISGSWKRPNLCLGQLLEKALKKTAGVAEIRHRNAGRLATMLVSDTVGAKVASERKAGFAKDVLKLASGTVLAQIISILSAPLLTRLFGPEAFGLAALFGSVSGIIGVVACLRYELSIMLPRPRRRLPICWELASSRRSGLPP